MIAHPVLVQPNPVAKGLRRGSGHPSHAEFPLEVLNNYDDPDKYVVQSIDPTSGAQPL